MIVFNLFPAADLLAIQASEQILSHLVSDRLLVLDGLTSHWIVHRLEVIGLHVDREESHWSDTSLDRDTINLTAHLLELD